MADDPIAAGVRLIQAREWYEAHEVLEVPWRLASGEEKLAIQALIQAAVSLEHLRRGSPRGAWGQWRKAREKMDVLPAVACGVALSDWRDALADFYAAIDLDERSRRAVARESMADLPPLPPESDWPLPERRSR
jgi:hypothetical protein